MGWSHAEPMTDGKMSSMDNPLSRKVDSLVSQMDQFSKQIEQYLGESSVDHDDDDESQDGDSDVFNFKMGLQELLQTPKYAMLRDYQQYGIKWLLSLHTSGLNGIIADEMGLGKTLQVIKFLAALKNQTGKVGPHLMIGPLSVLSNWYHEIEKYAPNEFDVYVHYGSKKEREQSFKEVCEDWRRLHRKTVKKSTKIAIILTTFNMAINDDSLFRNFTKLCGKPFDYLIVDEAHRIKNQSCVLYQQLKVFPVGYRLLLTGTPLQNNLQELWSLLKFLVPKIFPKHEDIQEWFSSYFQVDIDAAAQTHSISPSSSFSSTSSTSTATAAVSATVAPARKGTSTTTTTSTPTRGRAHKLFATKLALASAASSTSRQQDHTQLLKAIDRDKIIHSLHRVLKPFILRRIKADVAIDIPYKVKSVGVGRLKGAVFMLMLCVCVYIYIGDQGDQVPFIPFTTRAHGDLTYLCSRTDKATTTAPTTPAKASIAHQDDCRYDPCSNNDYSNDSSVSIRIVTRQCP